jgi:hypothetical protein
MVVTVELSQPYSDRRIRWKAPARFQPATAFDLDAAGGEELVVLADTGRVYALNNDGSEFLDRDNDPATVEAYFSAPGALWVGAPAFGDIDGGGDEEIVAASGNGDVYAWKGDSTEVFDGDGNPSTNGILYRGASLVAPPMLVDADDDTVDEITIVERVGDTLVVSFIDETGAQVSPNDPQIGSMWPVRLQAQYCAPLGFGALGANGRDTEGVVIAWADTIRSLYGISYYPVRNRSGTGWQVETITFAPKGSVKTSFPPMSSPAIGDLNGDRFEEVAVTTPDGRLVVFAPNNIFSENSTVAAQSTPPSMPKTFRITDLRGNNPSAPALGDVDGNGTLEIALYDDTYFYVFENNARLRTNWPQPLRPTSLGDFPTLAFEALLVSPLVGSVNGDGRTEILYPSPDGTIYAFHGDGSLVTGFPSVAPAGLGATPTIRDLDSDGELTLVSLGAVGLMETVDAVSDSILTEETVVLSIQSLPGSTAQGQNFWLMYQHDRSRRGRVAQINPVQTAGSITEPNSFIVYPNPVRDAKQVHARVILNQSATVGVEIYNLEGEKTISKQFAWNNSGGAIQTPFDETIDVTALASGVYLMRVSIEGSGGTETLVKTFAVLR